MPHTTLRMSTLTRKQIDWLRIHWDLTLKAVVAVAVARAAHHAGYGTPAYTAGDPPGLPPDAALLMEERYATGQALRPNPPEPGQEADHFATQDHLAYLYHALGFNQALLEYASFPVNVAGQSTWTRREIKSRTETLEAELRHYRDAETAHDAD